MRVYSTLQRALLELEPGEPGRIGMYVCGPTVQSPPHVGHGRAAVAFDVIRRYLTWRGFEVRFVRNITDVEDKIIAAAAEAGVPPEKHAAAMEERFAAAFRTLNVAPPDVEPKATEHIPEMVALISTLIERGLAYESGGDVYFSVRAFETYGKLSGRRPDELRAGARVEPSELKHDPLDFALWKAAKPGEPYWESPWGAGRPGWHIECSAMAMRYLGETLDIHGGGSDLIFPHHENEIAQSEGATGQPFSRYWLHNGMVNLGGEKMSKSTGHLVDLEEAIRRYGGMTVRLFYLRAHYRSPLEFSEELLESAQSAWERLQRLRARAAGEGEPDREALERFTAAMDDDFATPEALGVLFDVVSEANRRLDAGQDATPQLVAFHTMCEVLGLTGAPAGDLSDLEAELASLAAEVGVAANGRPAEVVDRILARRQTAREAREWGVADRIRDRLAELGIVVEDAAGGSRWLRR